MIDGEIVWLGTASPLRSVEATELCMVRTVSCVGAGTFERESRRGLVVGEALSQLAANS